jgi:hypothetical protein
MRPGIGLTAALVLVGSAVGGCGQRDDRDAVRTVTERFYAALEADDGERACEQLSESTRAELESQERRPCPEAVTELELQGGGISRIEVFVTNAKADLAGGESAFLARGAEGWRLSAIGCRPQDEPSKRPFDCELEA